MTIDEALETYLLQLEADGRSLNTRMQYARQIGLLARELPGKALEEVTHVDIARFLVSARATQRSDGIAKKSTSMNALRSSVRTFFGYVHAAGMISSNPARLVRRARCGPTPPRLLSEDEQARFLATLSSAQGWQAERDHLLFHLLLATGIRLGSLLGLNAPDVDLDRSEILLRTTKNDRPETVFLGRAIREHLAACMKTPGPLFPSRQGSRLSGRQVQRRFAMWLRRASITRAVTVHSLRHSFATALYHRTGDICLVQHALLHRSISSTMVYAKPEEARLRDALVGA